MASTVITVLIGLFILIVGYLVLTKKALFLINLVLWNGVEGDENFLSKIFGSILIGVGVMICLLPCIF